MASSSPFQIQQAPSSIPLFRAWGFLLLPEGLQQASLFWCWLAFLQSPFWGMLTRCQGPGIASYQLLMGTWQSRFHEHPKIQNKLCWRKDSGILELQAVNCVAMPNKKLFGFQLAIPWRQPLGRCVRQQVLFQNIDDYFTNPCFMAASAAVRQDGCLKSLLSAKI